jgi:hypothetical protein
MFVFTVETFTGTCSADANCTDKETVRTAITSIHHHYFLQQPFTMLSLLLK